MKNGERPRAVGSARELEDDAITLRGEGGRSSARCSAEKISCGIDCQAVGLKAVGQGGEVVNDGFHPLAGRIASQAVDRAEAVGAAVVSRAVEIALRIGDEIARGSRSLCEIDELVEK